MGQRPGVWKWGSMKLEVKYITGAKGQNGRGTMYSTGARVEGQLYAVWGPRIQNWD